MCHYRTSFWRLTTSALGSKKTRGANSFWKGQKLESSAFNPLNVSSQVLWWLTKTWIPKVYFEERCNPFDEARFTVSTVESRMCLKLWVVFIVLFCWIVDLAVCQIINLWTFFGPVKPKLLGNPRIPGSPSLHLYLLHPKSCRKYPFKHPRIQMVETTVISNHFTEPVVHHPIDLNNHKKMGCLGYQEGVWPKHLQDGRWTWAKKRQLQLQLSVRKMTSKKWDETTEAGGCFQK